MNGQYPDDADGDALRRVRENGADMSRPMRIDFTVDAANLDDAHAIAEIASEHGYEPSIYVDDEGGGGISVNCAVSMLATYDAIVARQAALTQLLVRFGVVCEAWGTHGNAHAGESV